MQGNTSRNLPVRISRESRRISTTVLQKVARTLTAVAIAVSGLGAVAMPAPAYGAGATYYVAKTGSDTTGDGSVTKPWATLQKAAATISGGDTVHVAPGTYAPFSIAKAGTATMPTRFVADGQVIISGGTHGITISADYVSVSGFTVTGFSQNGIYGAGRNYLTVSNCTIYDDNNGSLWYAGVYFERSTGHLIQGNHIYGLNMGGVHLFDCSNSTILNNEIHDLEEDGVLISGVNLTVDGNTIHDLDNNTNHSDGVVVQAPDYKTFGTVTKGIVIRNNKTYDNTQHIYVTAWGAAGGLVDGVSVYNNVCYVTKTTFFQTGLSFDRSTNGISMTNVDVYNNTVIDFAKAGASGMIWGARSTAGSYSNFEVKNNLFTNSMISYDETVAGLVLDHNLYYRPANTIIVWKGARYSSLSTFKAAVAQESHGVSGDPVLASDYRPGVGSMAVGAGIGPESDTNVPAADKGGKLRAGSTSSIGAYEYVTTAPPADTTAPTVTLTAPANGATVSGSVSLAAAAADNVGVVAVEFRADGVLVGTDTSAPYATTWNASAASAGAHAIQARAYDAAGNTTNANATVNVPAPPPADITAPVTTATNYGVAASGWLIEAPQVMLSANETATTQYQWDGAVATAWNAYSAPITAPEGQHTLYYRSTDLSGNTENAKTLALKVDTGAPTVPAVTAISQPDPAIPSTSAAAEFTFDSDDSVSGVAAYSYSFDRNATTVPDEVSEGTAVSAQFPVSEDGAWYFHVRSRDTAGNWSATAHHEILVDLPEPIVAELAAPNVNVAVVGNAANLSWTPSPESVATRVVRSQTGFAASPTDGSQTLIYEGAETTFSDTGLASGATYYYTAFARNAAGQWSSGATVKAVLKAPTSLALSASASSVLVNKYVSLTADYFENGVKGKAPAVVTVWSDASGAWTQIGTATYSSTLMSYTYRTRVTKSTTYQFRTAGDATRAAAESNTKWITAKSSVSVKTSPTKGK